MNTLKRYRIGRLDVLMGTVPDYQFFDAGFFIVLHLGPVRLTYWRKQA
jgi:hypothetical protein